MPLLSSGEIEALTLMLFTAYVLYLLRNRGKFSMSGKELLPVLLTATLISLLLEYGVGLRTEAGEMTLGYLGLFFFSAAFGETVGVASAMGVAFADYLSTSDVHYGFLSLLAASAAAIVTGKTSKISPEFSVLLSAAVLGGLTALILWVPWFWGTAQSVSRTIFLMSPLSASVSTGVVAASALVLWLRRENIIGEPIEKRD